MAQGNTKPIRSQILCIGCPMWDTYLFMPEEFLPKAARVGVRLNKGDATKCTEYSSIEALLSLAKPFTSSSSSSSTSKSSPSPSGSPQAQDELHDCGGCVVNTAKVLASLGSDTALVGTRGDDATGIKFVDRLNVYGVVDLTIPIATRTGGVLCFITPDAQRTFAYFPGASCELSFDRFVSKVQRRCSSSSLATSAAAASSSTSSASFDISLVGLAYVDCYTFLVPGKAAEKIVEYMTAEGAAIALNTGSVGIVTDQLRRLRDVVYRFCDVVLANEEESLALAESGSSAGHTRQDVEDAACNISELMTSSLAVCIVTLGKAGCCVAVNGRSFGIVPPLPEDVVDDPIGGYNCIMYRVCNEYVSPRPYLIFDM